MTSCAPRTVDLCRGCRIHISWPVTGMEINDTAQASLNAGPWVDLVLAPDGQSIIGYFAGPDYASPGAATVVAEGAYVEIRVITTTEQLEFPGGFIRLSS